MLFRSAGDLKDGARAALRLAEALPEIAAKTEKLHGEIVRMSEHGLRFDPETTEAIGRSEARHSWWGRLALWVIAASLLLIAVKIG